MMVRCLVAFLILVLGTAWLPMPVGACTRQIDGTSALHAAFRMLLDSAHYLGLEKEKYHYRQLFGQVGNSQAGELLFDDALFSFCRDVHAGSSISTMFSYNSFAGHSIDSFLRTVVTAISTPADIAGLPQRLEPHHRLYHQLKAELRTQLTMGEPRKIKQLQDAMNVQRYLSHFHFAQRIVVNIASASLSYYQDDELVLYMKTVVGKPATKTPRFAAHCHQVIFYPYWHVPYSIAVNEILPMCKRNPSVLKALNMQVINSKGIVVNPASVNWKSLGATNFPYQLRQSTGCDNALGVIKFNLTSPYSVYLHDTNNKDAFLSARRYYSHGCIRIEKPVELASYLLPDKVDSAFLKACVRDQKPVTSNLQQPVPVFVIYATADAADTGAVKYHTDVYHLNN